MKRWLLVVFVLIGGILSFLYYPHQVAAQGEIVKIIPTFFGQGSTKKDWFWYKTAPGQQLKIDLTMVNLTPSSVKGRIGIEDKGIIKSDWLPFELLPNGRQELQLKLKIKPEVREREYVLELKAENKKGLLLAKTPLDLVVGKNLQPDFQVTNLQLKPGREGVKLRFHLANDGQLSLKSIDVQVRYKNKWWFGLAKVEEFTLDKKIPPQTTAKISQDLSLPSGVLGPVTFLFQIKAAEKTLVLRRTIFWFPFISIIRYLGYIILFFLILGISFKFIFKGAAGLIYRYLEEKIHRSPSPLTRGEDKTIGNILQNQGSSSPTYAQFLLDVRQIVREEMELHRRLFLAESEKQSLQLLMDLVKKGHLKLLAAAKNEKPQKKTKKKKN